MSQSAKLVYFRKYSGGQKKCDITPLPFPMYFNGFTAGNNPFNTPRESNIVPMGENLLLDDNFDYLP